jgi:hypothetical protein
MSREGLEEALLLLRELGAPAATAIELFDGPVCGICEQDLTGEEAESGHTSDCLVMRVRAFLSSHDREAAPIKKGGPL